METSGEGRQGRKSHPKLSLAWKIITITFGSGLILAGIAGLFLPILQGWLMIFAGLAVLGPYSKRARWVMRTLKERFRFLHRRGGATEAAEEAAPEEPDRDRKTGS